MGHLTITCSRVLLDHGGLVLAELAQPLVIGTGDDPSAEPFDDRSHGQATRLAAGHVRMRLG